MTRPAGPETNPSNRVIRPPTPTPSPGAGAERRPSRKARGLPSGFASIRDLLSFFAGLAIIAHEVWWSDKIEVALLTVGVALAGLPVVFGADEKRKPPAEP